ncbi:MAG: Dabb family protein [Campylobacteraceae bacterium]|nr:Dabb family protein [Campylobacteraceae bacterium]
MIKHMLLIEFKDFVSLEQLSDLKKIFESIPNKIEGVSNVEWGLNNSPENLNKNYTHSIVMSFKDEKTRENYFPHAEHERLKEVFLPMIEDILVFDYVIS